MKGSRVAVGLWLACFFLFGGPAWGEGPVGSNPVPVDIPLPTDPPPANPTGYANTPAPIPDSNPMGSAPVLPDLTLPGQAPAEAPPTPDTPAAEKREAPAPGQGQEEGGPAGDPEGLSATSTASSTSVAAQDASENPVAGLIGNVEVGRASGAATAEIPIYTPPGRNGLTPKIVLRYSSVGGPSPYGRGWNLELGHIQRSTRRGVPKYNDTDDYFVLFLPGGQMVELVTKTNEIPLLPPGQVRWVPKVEEAFLRVVQDVTNKTWTVWDKGGTKFVFGETNTRPGSDTTLSARVGRDISQASGTFGWSLTRIEDPNGNTLQITYEAVTGETSRSYIYPKWIDYGANPGASFLHKHHLTLTWGPRPDIVESYSGGYLSRMSRRLSLIQVQTDGINAGLPFQTYELAYLPSPNSQQSLLASVRRNGVDLSDSSTKSLPLASFSYRDNSTPDRFKFSDSAYTSWTLPQLGDWLSVPCYADRIWCKGPTNQDTYRKTIDMDGDGRPDFVDTKVWSSTNKNWKVYRNNGQGFDLPRDWAAPEQWVQTINEVTADSSRDTLDLDGDGKPDYVDASAWSSTNKFWKVYRNNGQGFASTAILWWAPEGWVRTVNEYTGNTSRDLMDLNADGLVDYVQASDWTGSNQSWKVYFNTGTGFQQTLTSFPVLRQTGGSETLNEIRDTGGALVNTFDINNDGLADHIRASTTTGVWKIYLNEGDRIRYRTDWTPPLNRIRHRDPNNTDNYLWDTFDINSDGHPDLVDARDYDVNGGYWKVYLGTGQMDAGGSLDQGFRKVPKSWKAPFHRIRYAWGKDKDVFDLDGDNLVDYVDGETVGGVVTWKVWFNQGFDKPQLALQSAPDNPVRPDLLEVADNGLGGKTSVTYLPSTVWPNGGTDGIPDLPFPVWTVDSLTREDGLGAVHVADFSYQDGKLDSTDPLGIEFRGFGLIREIDPLDNLVESRFHQDLLKKGKPDSLKVYSAPVAGTPVKETVWSWTTRNFTDPLVGQSRTHLYLLQRAELLYAEGSSCEDLLTVQESFDGYGNVTASHTLGQTQSPCPTQTPQTTTAQVNTTTTYTPRMGTYIVDRPASLTIWDAKGDLEKKSFGYDTWGNQIRVTRDPDAGGIQAITTRQYDAFGNMTQETNARRNPTTYAYDPNYQTYPTTVQKPLPAHRITQTFDARWGKLTSSKYPDKDPWLWSYDAFGRPAKAAQPKEKINNPLLLSYLEKPQKVFTYTDGSPGVPGRMTVELKEPNAASGYRKEVSFFDGLGRLLQEKHEAYVNGNKTAVAGRTLVYDGRGRVKRGIAPFVTTEDVNTYSPRPTNPGTDFDYDALDRVVRQTNPDGTFKSFTYSGFTATLIDEAGNRRKTIPDAYGRTTREELYQGTFTLLTERDYTYDGLGRLLSKKVGNNLTTTITISYDRLGRKMSMSDPDSGLWRYTYDEEDNLKTQTDPQNRTITFTYDALDRLETKLYPNGSQVNFRYDTNPNGETCSSDTGLSSDTGRLCRVDDPSGRSTFAYDQPGNLRSKTQSIGSTVGGKTFLFATDEANRVKSLTYPGEGTVSAEVVTNSYTDTGQLKSVSGLTPYVTSILYDHFGRSTQVTYGNNVVDKREYSGAPGNFRLLTLQTLRGGEYYQNLSYTYDLVGNISQITDPLSNGARNNSQSYTYDGLYRLIHSSRSQLDPCDYDYDNIGNIQNKCGLEYIPNPNKPHQYISIGSMGIGYDQNGNLTSKTGSTGYSAAYDSDDRLWTITAGGATFENTYDYAGQRVQRKRISPLPEGAPVRYWDNLLEIEGSTLRKHYFALGVRIATREEGAVNSLRFYHPDHLGSPQVLTNGSNGDVVQYIRYLPYGGIRGIFDKDGRPVSDPPASRYLFTDKERDAETGLDYFGARFYDSEIALFLTHDPQAQFDSPYSYADGNPVNLVDPDGESFLTDIGGWALRTVTRGILDMDDKGHISLSMPSLFAGVQGSDQSPGEDGGIRKCGNDYCIDIKGPKDRGIPGPGVPESIPDSGGTSKKGSLGDAIAKGVDEATMRLFLQQHRPEAVPVAQQWATRPEFILSVSASESTWGTSPIARGAQNYFGMHAGEKWEGEIAWTRKGALIRRYFSFKESLADWADRWGPKVQGTKGMTMEKFIGRLQRPPLPYNTENPNFARDLMRVYRSVMRRWE